LPEFQVTAAPISIFLSYSRKDKDLLNSFRIHLAGLVNTGQITTWHDRDIEAGSEWEPILQHQLNTAKIIILLISANFIASEYCYGNELKRAIERHDAGAAHVIPVILKPCLWNRPKIPFSKLNVLPNDALAV
jgi:TIR domain